MKICRSKEDIIEAIKTGNTGDEFKLILNKRLGSHEWYSLGATIETASGKRLMMDDENTVYPTGRMVFHIVVGISHTKDP